MSLLKQSTARNSLVFMTDSTDNITGKSGLTLTITSSKDGATFLSITPAVTELSNGWYSLALTTAHTDTLGDFALHITATNADPYDEKHQVVVDLPGASVSSVTGSVGSVTATVAANLTQILGTVLTETSGQLAGGFKKWFNVATPTGTVNSIPDVVAGATNGIFIAGTNAATTITTSLTTTFTGNLTGSVGSVTGLTASNLDTTVSSRLASVDYTAPDNTTITAINTKIGTPASTVSGDIASVNTTVNFIEALNL